MALRLLTAADLEGTHLAGPHGTKILEKFNELVTSLGEALPETIEGAQAASLAAMLEAFVGYVEGLQSHTDNGLVARVPLTALLADVADLRTKLAAAVVDLAAIRSAYNATLAKLDADDGVTDTDYAATNPAPALTATAPAAATATTSQGISNGSTAGTLRTNTDTQYAIDGKHFTKASTNNLWDLSAEADTGAGEFRAYWLLLDDAGAASILAGDDADSEEAAIAALPDPTEGTSVIGAYVAGESTDFDAGGGLAAQGTIINGWPSNALA